MISISGFVVFAGCLNKNQGGDGARKLDAEGKSTGRLITVQLNVTSDDEVQAAVRYVKAKMPPGVLVNFFLSYFTLSHLENSYFDGCRDCGLLLTMPDFQLSAKWNGFQCLSTKL